MKRTVLGTLGGALFGGAIAAAIPFLLIVAILLLAESHPIDRERDLAMLPYTVAFCGVCGTIVGTLAGLASHLPKSGIPFFPCFASIALGVGAVRLLTAPRPKVSEADQYYFSYAASLVAGMVITVFLISLAVNRSRSTPSNGL